jgi:uncharacterized protein (DUF2267 family)
MSITGLSAFDVTVEKTNLWLKEIAAELGTDDRHRAYLALRQTLHALRDRLPIDEAAELGAQLPMLVRGFYYEGWRPSTVPHHVRSKQEFLAQIAAAFHDDALDAEPIVRAVLKVVDRHITRGEAAGVKHVLPSPIRELWPGVAASRPVGERV